MLLRIDRTTLVAVAGSKARSGWVKEMRSSSSVTVTSEVSLKSLYSFSSVRTISMRGWSSNSGMSGLCRSRMGSGSWGSASQLIVTVRVGAC